MSRPVAPDYNMAMQQFTNMSCTTTNQHKDTPDESMKSDAADLDKISSKSLVWSPDSSLRDLVTGGMTGEGVNVHENKSVRCNPMHTSVWQPALTLSLGKSCK